MTQDEIIRSPIGREQLVALAREAGFFEFNIEGWINEFQRFAALVAAHEREACAKVCEDDMDWLDNGGGELCAAAIRSRCSQGSRSEK